ncbi:MAG: hypothetical protein BWK76_10020 [Desulfobulbaceae bacterium A2]|nr:MAG: hypothetical protein BWK76_10020 [Desulfobulbaceae bacterium A2]
MVTSFIARLLTLFFLATMALVQPRTSAALMISLSVEELTQTAGHVLHGVVLASAAAWSTDGRSIVTNVQVSVREELKGQVKSENVTLQLPGGEVDGMGLMVSNTPVFQQGEEVVLFLDATGSNGTAATTGAVSQAQAGTLRLVGGAQGAYTIDQSGATIKGRAQFFGNSEGEGGGGSVVPVDELLSRIRAAAAAGQ